MKLFHSVRPSDRLCLSVGPAFCVCSVTPTVLDGFFPYYAQMTSSMRGCHMQWLFTLTYILRSFSHEFAIKLLRYGTSCHVHSTACTVLDRLFPYLAQMIPSIRGCVTCNDLWSQPISSSSFSHGFAIKQLEYNTSCCVRSTALAVLDDFLHIWHKW